ncbi:carboxyl transferase domain-containing protein [Shimia thalassica]|uniref:acyl-CoA carboxylase subunit beta n=1 Tax=Shimia thalassica TaxID=1715693 RepID=UPI001C098983|nr:carboxyl transferase domain-containing protein [Shimia thalassica]MBU2944164.1 acyl-CoA carboxylase subunit beta [Shimia thalassica]MDO6503677.1 carboxyl transferase domain-containing protein [Shimia thalassica]
MAVFKSGVSVSSDAFSKNRQDMLSLIADLRDLEARGPALSAKRNETFAKRGQINPHDRVARLLDPGMPFLQLHALANYMSEDTNPATSVPGASIICGIGFVNGVRAMIWADDSGIRAGSLVEASLDVILSLQEIAKRQNLPLIHLVESAGANLMGYKVEFFVNGGAMFRNLAQMSAAGVPTLAVLHGPSTAGGAYMPGMSDYVIGVKENGLAALAGAALLHAATGEQADERQLGGTEMHASQSGLVEYLADDDAHALSLARDVVGRFNWNASQPPLPRQPFVPPVYDAEELAGVVPVDHRTPYDVREVLARVVDGSDFEDFKPRYGASLVCAQASIMGLGVGIIGNNGPIDPAGATKAAQFIQLCDQAGLPLVFLNNITGYMVGTEYEQAGMIKHGAKMIQAVTNARVPKISMYIGASFGAGNYGMCGYAYDPDFLFSWPNAAIGVMGGEQAAKTMSTVARAGAMRKGVDLDEGRLKAQEGAITAHFTSQESAFYGSGRCLDHGVIDPRDTRKVLGFALETVLEGRARQLNPNSFGVARM